MIRAYGDEKRFILDSEAKIDTNQSAYFPSILSQRWLDIQLEMLGVFVIMLASLLAVMSSNIDPGDVGLSIAYALQVYKKLKKITKYIFVV